MTHSIHSCVGSATLSSQADGSPSSMSVRENDEPSSSSLHISPQQSTQRGASPVPFQASDDATALPNIPKSRERSPNGSTKSTPTECNENSTYEQKFCDCEDVEAHYIHYAKEIQSYVLGPMPCDEFLKNICHGYRKMSFDGMPSSVDAFKDIPQQAEKELQICDPFVNR